MHPLFNSHRPYSDLIWLTRCYLRHRLWHGQLLLALVLHATDREAVGRRAKGGFQGNSTSPSTGHRWRRFGGFPQHPSTFYGRRIVTLGRERIYRASTQPGDDCATGATRSFWTRQSYGRRGYRKWILLHPPRASVSQPHPAQSPRPVGDPFSGGLPISSSRWQRLEPVNPRDWDFEDFVMELRAPSSLSKVKRFRSDENILGLADHVSAAVQQNHMKRREGSSF